MKLYFTPGACSLSPHIVLHELGMPFESEVVDLRVKTTKGGADYRAINPKGAVPALQLDDGQVLTEGTAIIQYLADRAPAAKLVPPAGSMERYRLAEWLSYISMEVHKSFGLLFRRDVPDDIRDGAQRNLESKLDFLNGKLSSKPFLMGDAFSVADAYLYAILTWTRIIKLDLAKWPGVKAYVDRIGDRPAVQATLAAEKAARAA